MVVSFLGTQAAWGFDFVYGAGTSANSNLCDTSKCRSRWQPRWSWELCLPLIQEAASKVVNVMGSRSNQVNRVYPMLLFKVEAGKILKLQNELSNGDLNLILTYLARDKSAIVYDAEVSYPHAMSAHPKLCIRLLSLRWLVRLRPHYPLRTKQ